VLALTCVLGCAPAAPGPAEPDPPASLNQLRAPTAAVGDAAGAGPVSPPPTSTPEVAPPAPERFAGSTFPPASVEALHERTGKPDDGQWAAFAGLPPGIAYRTTLHPHPIKKWIQVTVVAFDRRLVDLTLMAGTQEPVSDAVPADKRPGLVPSTHYDDLLVVFNGGFKAQHGRYGMMLGGDVFVPPKDDACGIGFFAQDRLVVAPWQSMAGDAANAGAWRQTPPCLVVDGVKNERLKSEYRSRKWGAAKGGARDIRRSALGLDASGRTLMYGFGEWVSAGELADAMQRAGAADAAELDINWSYTRFYWFERAGSEAPRIVGSIVPKAEYSPRRYIEKSSFRDFFYVTRRALP
jgi:hypothetical protein